MRESCRPLCLLVEQASAFHTSEWFVARLPSLLGARRVDFPSDPALLGAAVATDRKRAIAINARIELTPLEVPVVAHECAHLMLGHRRGFCQVGGRSGAHERDAWSGAAILAIPSMDGVALAEHRATARELAAQYSVPIALAHMRGSLAVLLGETVGNREQARDGLLAARSSLDHWIAWVATSL